MVTTRIPARRAVDHAVARPLRLDPATASGIGPESAPRGATGSARPSQVAVRPAGAASVRGGDRVDEPPLRGVPPKPQVEIGRSDDPEEHAADRVADDVMSSPGGVRGARDDTRSTPEPVLADLPAGVRTALTASGQPLDPDTRRFFEPRLGRDLDGVRVYTDTPAAESARSLGARAYTVGSRIAFGAGQYQPGTQQGRQLLAHELAHVAQSATRASRRPTIRRQTATPAGGPQPDTVTEVGTFHPAPNLTVDRTGQAMNISGTIKVRGSDASADKAATAQATINRYWNKTFPDGRSVSCSVGLIYAPSTSTSFTEAVIEMTQISGPSHVNSLTHTMTLNMKESNALTWVVAHEFGHQLGLKDRYSETIGSQIRGSFGGQRTTTVTPGYEGNLMAASGGETSSRNVDDLASENKASNLDDDNQVREWVTRNPEKIAGLSAASKIRMFARLLDGWISDEDVAAIGTICSATPATQSAQVASYLTRRLSDISSIGQRTRVRGFIGQLPR